MYRGTKIIVTVNFFWRSSVYHRLEITVDSSLCFHGDRLRSNFGFLREEALASGAWRNSLYSIRQSGLYHSSHTLPYVDQRLVESLRPSEHGIG